MNRRPWSSIHKKHIEGIVDQTPMHRKKQRAAFFTHSVGLSFNFSTPRRNFFMSVAQSTEKKTGVRKGGTAWETVTKVKGIGWRKKAFPHCPAFTSFMRAFFPSTSSCTLVDVTYRNAQPPSDKWVFRNRNKRENGASAGHCAPRSKNAVAHRSRGDPMDFFTALSNAPFDPSRSQRAKKTLQRSH